MPATAATRPGTTFLSFETELGTGIAGVYENDPDGFLAGEVCFHIDGSFRLGTIASNAPDLNFGVVELPEHNGIKSTFGSYWTHGITTKAAADPARIAAATKFLQFITTPEAGTLWVGIVGELPAQLEAAADPALLADEKLGAFAAGLEYAQSTFFVDESKDRQAIIDAYDAVVLTGADPAAELDFAVETVQEMLDEFWAASRRVETEIRDLEIGDREIRRYSTAATAPNLSISNLPSPHGALLLKLTLRRRQVLWAYAVPERQPGLLHHHSLVSHDPGLQHQLPRLECLPGHRPVGRPGRTTRTSGKISSSRAARSAPRSGTRSAMCSSACRCSWCWPWASRCC